MNKQLEKKIISLLESGIENSESFSRVVKSNSSNPQIAEMLSEHIGRRQIMRAVLLAMSGELSSLRIFAD